MFATAIDLAVHDDGMGDLELLQKKQKKRILKKVLGDR